MSRYSAICIALVVAPFRKLSETTHIFNVFGCDSPLRYLRAKDCMFRINRDIRFSKDKSPYKSNFGASINKGGRKAMKSAGYYFHPEPGNCFAGGGIYMSMPDELKKLRQEIDYNFSDFKKILNEKNQISL